MKVLVIGSGGREHTIVWKLNQSDKVSELFIAPGNAGTASLGINININAEDIDGLLQFAVNNKIDMTVVGPEVPLVEGIVDRFREKDLRILGPDKKGATLEGSKAYAKKFMEKYNMPTGKYKEYTNYDEARKGISEFGYPVVIKADGLAAGKGVLIPENEKEALDALKMIMKDKRFGTSGSKVIIEEFLRGIEASMICFVDNNTIVPMVSAKDYKRALDGDKGLNTGGMGTFSPNTVVTEALQEKINVEVLEPFMKGIKEEGIDFRGILFVGLMIDGKDIKILEFNTRFGDPETQVILPRLESDLFDIFNDIIDNKLSGKDIKWTTKKAICIVATSGGYPEAYEKGKVINISKDVYNKNNVHVFHAGTKNNGDNIVTNGGRVLGVVALEDSLDAARETSYGAMKSIEFNGLTYRRDIGFDMK